MEGAGRIISAFLTSSAVRGKSDRVLTFCHWLPRREREREGGGNPYETLLELLDLVYHSDRETC